MCRCQAPAWWPYGSAVHTHGMPNVISIDNGPALVTKGLNHGAHRREVKLAFNRSGNPTCHAVMRCHR